MLVDTPDGMCPSDNARTKIDPNHNLPASETLRFHVFSECHDSYELKVEHKDASKELHESENYNYAKVVHDGIDEVVVPIGMVDPEFALTSEKLNL